MATSRLERENLEAHVDLCAERYKTLEEKFGRLETKVDQIADNMVKMVEKQQTDKVASNKLIIGAAGSVIAGLLSTIVLLLMNLNNVAPVITTLGQ
jgi:pantothenate kinase